jgi:hypothetical protein
MMGGCVQKYFPEGLNVFDFNELEMNRIIACAFSLKDVQNMINTVIKERPDPDAENGNCSDRETRGRSGKQ